MVANRTNGHKTQRKPILTFKHEKKKHNRLPNRGHVTGYDAMLAI